MKVIEAMKRVKELEFKAESMRTKVALNCADMDYETPLYGNPESQKEHIAELIQGHGDVIKEMLDLKNRIALTNMETDVVIKLGDDNVSKSVAKWILRRRLGAAHDLKMQKQLTDRGINEQAQLPPTGGGTATPVKIRRYFDPLERDKLIDLYTSEPSRIDAALEISNAITDLVE